MTIQNEHRILKMSTSKQRTKQRIFSPQILAVLNVSLILVSTLLLLNLMGVGHGITGQMIHGALDKEHTVCLAQFQDHASQINIDICCQEANKQLSCKRHQQTTNGLETEILCTTGEGSISYALNSEAFNYCEAYY